MKQSASTIRALFFWGAMSTADFLDLRRVQFRDDAQYVPPSERRQVYPELRRRLVAGDAVAATLAWAIPSLWPGTFLSQRLQSPSVADVAMLVGGLCIAVTFTLCILASERLYRARICSMRTVEIARIARASLVVGTAALVVGKFIGESHLARVPLMIVVFTFVLLNIWRASYANWLRNARSAGRFTRPVLLIGTNEEAHNLSRLIESHPELGYRFIGVVGELRNAVRHDFDLPYLGDLDDLSHVLKTSGVKGAIVVGGAVGRGELNVAIRNLLAHEVHVHLSTGINGIDHRRLHNHALAYEPLVYVERAQLERWQLIVKRVIDVSLSSFVLAITSPLILASVIAIRMHDGGPALFRQERVGHHGRPFKMLKLRSMVINAESQLADLRDQNQRHGPLFKLASDPRVTPIGRLLRATSIDELPQLINVIRGDMSLVGPRPALSHEVEMFDDDLTLMRQNVQPGITGLWQVEGRDNPDFAMYQRLDVFYVENWSVSLDISILVNTVRVVLGRARKAAKRPASASPKTQPAIVLE